MTKPCLLPEKKKQKKKTNCRIDFPKGLSSGQFCFESYSCFIVIAEMKFIFSFDY